MSDKKNLKHTFYAVKCQQRDAVLFLTTIKGSDLENLCAGLRSPDFREQPISTDSNEVESSAKQFVDAVSSSAFAAEVSSIEASSYSDENPYQRIIDEARVKSIAAYLQEDFALVPNGVVLAVGEDVSSCVKWGKRSKFAKIELSWGEGIPLHIIDGQHRVEGLKQVIKDGKTEFRDFELPVCLLLELPFYLQAELFAVINGKQKPVPRSRIYDLLGYRPIKDKDLREKAYKGELAIHRFCHLAVRVLNNTQKSPWHNRIKMRGSGPGIVTQAAMVDHLASLLIPKKNSLRVLNFPLLYRYFKAGDLLGFSKVCVIYFLGIAKAWPDIWNNDDHLKATLFGKTSGVAVMFMILHDLALLEGGAEFLTVEKVEKYWKNAPLNRINKPPQGGSRGYQLEWYRAIMEKIVGADFVGKIATAREAMREKMKTEGGLF